MGGVAPPIICPPAVAPTRSRAQVPARPPAGSPPRRPAVGARPAVGTRRTPGRCPWSEQSAPAEPAWLRHLPAPESRPRRHPPTCPIPKQEVVTLDEDRRRAGLAFSVLQAPSPFPPAARRTARPVGSLR